MSDDLIDNDVYEEDNDLLEDDEIDDKEEAFMKGYLEANEEEE